MTAAIVTRRATLDDVARAGDVLADAFADYPWTRWTVDPLDHQVRIAALQRMAVEHYGLAHGRVWVTSVGDEIHSVAVWMDSAAEVPASVHTRLSARVAELEGSRHESSQAAERELEPSRPAHRVWILATVGTTAEMQRRGLATRTLEPMLVEADSDGVDAFLETSSESNVAFYGRLGFAVIHHCAIDGGGPQVWTMLRRPFGGVTSRGGASS